MHGSRYSRNVRGSRESLVACGTRVSSGQPAPPAAPNDCPKMDRLAEDPPYLHSCVTLSALTLNFIFFRASACFHLSERA
ncbi:unnamed protein product [Pieris brassicae]|uniref:Uncharacterized protein n=1 Tax=Pieris brassicae TaxID=7116 RepID=A0A9P0TPR4_PIEBR|nr:unnamed protein product [Pieris brassicae]